MAVAGLRGTGDWGTDERPKNFRENILWAEPAGTSPIFAFTGRAGKKTVNDPEFSWWNETLNLVHLQVNGALGSSDTVVTVDGVDPTATTLGALYGSAKHLKAGDLLMVKPSTDNATFNPEMIQVVSVLSDTQFTVLRAAGGTTAGAIANDAHLLLIGSAFAEGTGAPPPTTRNPVKYNNYTQIFKDTYELTGTADATATRTGNPWSNDKKRKSFDHARSIELAILFGQKSEAIGTNGKPIRTMGGIRSLLPASRQVVFSAPVTPDSYLETISPVFDFGIGGNTRMVFGGNGAIIELGKVMRNATNSTMELGNVVKVYGVDFQEFILPRGRLLMHSHPLLSQDPMYKYSQFVVDFSSLKYVALKGRDTRTFDDVQTKDEDVRRGYIMTEASIMLDFGGLSMMYLGNILAA